MEKGEIARLLIRVPGQGGSDLRTGDVNTARGFLILKDWHDRDHTAREIAEPVLEAARKLPGVTVQFGQPGGIGRGGLQSPVVAVLGGPDYEQLAVWSDELLQLAQRNPGLTNVRSN